MPDASAPSLPHIPPRQRFGKAVEFVRFDLHTKLWSKQAEILRLLKHSKRTAVRSCNGSGKTHVAAAAVIWWLMAHEHKSALAITTAPTQRQVTNLLWREIRSIYFRNAAFIDSASSPGMGELEGENRSRVTRSRARITKTSLELSPNHYAMGLSTDSPERFQGFHEENILFVVDEASGVHEEVYEAIEGSMTSRRARLLLIGNPTSVSGTFYKAFHQNRTQYKKIHISAFDTPNIRSSYPPSQAGRELEGGSVQLTPSPRGEGWGEGEVIDSANTNQTRITNTSHEAGANSSPPHTIGPFHPEIPGIIKPSWLRDAELTWGEHSSQYQVRVLGEFPIDADDTLIPLRQIEAALSNGSDPTPAHRAVDLTSPITIGVDVARFGTDRTVICIRQGNHVLALNQHQKLNTMRTTGLVVNAIHKYNPQTVKIDEIGIGAGVLDRLHELNHNQVHGINVGNKPTDPEHFFNLRSELYDILRARFENQTIVIPNDDDLIGQLAAIRVEYTSRGQLKVEPKETMRRRSLPSPDKADALLLAFAPTPIRNNFKAWLGPESQTNPTASNLSADRPEVMGRRRTRGYTSKTTTT